jgi:hypothetical protein
MQPSPPKNNGTPASAATSTRRMVSGSNTPLIAASSHIANAL